MNFLFKRAASAATKQTLTSLTTLEKIRFVSPLPDSLLRSSPVIAAQICSLSCGQNQTSEKLPFGLHGRDFQTLASPLGFRASDIVRSEYAVDEFSDEEKNHGKKAGEVDEGLEIAKLGISQEIVSALEKKGITKLFPIQKAVLEPAMQGRDMIGRAKTGTGKTLAFGIPILDNIIRFNDKHGRGRNPLALVLAPTRELARQVEKEFKESAPVLDTLCVYGGVPIFQQMKTLDWGVDVVVGTPGRIIDLLKRGALNLSEVQFVVLDEADQMLAVGFDEDVETILEKLPQKRQSMMFSATMPTWIRKLTHKYLNDPLNIDLVGDSNQKLAEGITLYSIATDMYGKSSILGPIITEHARGGKCIVFTQTKRDADRLAYAMARNYKCEALHGDISQNQRERTLAGFRDGHFNILVATDVAARGLDIPNVDLIVHYELPSTSELFVHRSGRTGRAGKKGTAILIYTDHQTRAVRVIERDVGCRFKELPRIHVENGGADMLGDIRGGRLGNDTSGPYDTSGRFGGGRMGDSGFRRSGGFSGSGFGRSSGFGGPSRNRMEGGYSESGSGSYSSGRSSMRRGGFDSGFDRFGGGGGDNDSGFSRSRGFGDLGSGRSSGAFGDPGSGRSSGFGSSRSGQSGGFGESVRRGSGSSRFGSFGDD